MNASGDLFLVQIVAQVQSMINHNKTPYFGPYPRGYVDLNQFQHHPSTNDRHIQYIQYIYIYFSNDRRQSIQCIYMYLHAHIIDIKHIHTKFSRN